MKDEYLCILKLGNLYLKYISIDDYNDEIRVSYTNIINEAKRFDINDIELYKKMIELLTECTFEIITEVKENEGE